MSDSGARKTLAETLSYLVNGAATLPNVTATVLMLLICGATLGGLAPEIAAGQFGPNLMAFVTAIGVNMFSDVLLRLRGKQEKGEPLTQDAIRSLMDAIQTSGLESKLSEANFKLEMRDLLADQNVMLQIIVQATDNTQKLIIDAMGTQIDLLLATIMPPILNIVRQNNALFAEVQQLTVLVRERRALEAVQQESREIDASKKSIFVNNLPKVINHFKDREPEQEKIANWLKQGERLVTIHGMSGVGKTALACKVLENLQSPNNDLQPDGIVCLSAGSESSTGISWDQIFNDLLKLLPNETAAAITDIYRDPQVPTAQKVSRLLSAMGNGFYILLLDNLDAVQDPETYELTDLDLEQFLKVAIGEGNSLLILVTSQLPVTLDLTLASYQQRCPLREGLPVPDAIMLLRDLDDGTTGLSDAEITKLETLVTRTRGFPRALELTVGWLKDRDVDLDRLLNDPALVITEIITPFIGRVPNPPRRGKYTPSCPVRDPLLVGYYLDVPVQQTPKSNSGRLEADQSGNMQGPTSPY